MGIMIRKHLTESSHNIPDENDEHHDEEDHRPKGAARMNSSTISPHPRLSEAPNMNPPMTRRMIMPLTLKGETWSPSEFLLL